MRPCNSRSKTKLCNTAQTLELGCSNYVLPYRLERIMTLIGSPSEQGPLKHKVCFQINKYQLNDMNNEPM